MKIQDLKKKLDKIQISNMSACVHYIKQIKNFNRVNTIKKELVTALNSYNTIH